MTVVSGDRDMPNKKIMRYGSDEYDLQYRAPGIRIGSSLPEDIESSEVILEVDLFLDENGDLINELRSLLSKVEIAQGSGFGITMHQGFGLTCSKRLDIHVLREEVQQVISTLSSIKVVEK